jgi:hypothetical protein
MGFSGSDADQSLVPKPRHDCTEKGDANESRYKHNLRIMERRAR